jgi:hypothetical protein
MTRHLIHWRMQWWGDCWYTWIWKTFATMLALLGDPKCCKTNLEEWELLHDVLPVGLLDLEYVCHNVGVALKCDPKCCKTNLEEWELLHNVLPVGLLDLEYVCHNVGFALKCDPKCWIRPTWRNESYCTMFCLRCSWIWNTFATMLALL